LVPKQSRSTAGWASLILKVADFGIIALSAKGLPFNSTRGFLGEGPGLRRTQPPVLDIRTRRTLTPVVAERRERLRREFAAFLWITGQIAWDQFMAMPADFIDRALAAFGQALFFRRPEFVDLH
jgi:hypothetical protein